MWNDYFKDKTVNRNGPTLKLSELMGMCKAVIKRRLQDREFYSVYHSEGFMFRRVGDNTVVIMEPMLFVEYEEILSNYKWEIDHDPFMLYMPIEVD